MAKGSFLNKKEMIFFKKHGTLERKKEHWDVENINKKETILLMSFLNHI